MTTTTIDGPSTVQIEVGQHSGSSTDAPTVLFVDAVRSTGSSNHNVDTSGRPTNHRQIEQTVSLIHRYHGTLIKMIGDSLLAEFPDPVSAVRSGIEIERLVEQCKLTIPWDSQLDLRIGIHASAGSSGGIDVFGEFVNWAVGITKHAAPGQILVSRAVYETVSRETDLHCQWVGKAGIQGQTEEEDVFEVSWAEAPSNIPSRFKVLAQIGTGGMGVVYKVQDLETNEIMALKVLKPGTASDPAMQESLRREVCLARKVTHKNVCRIHEFNRSNGVACISMEFIEGESLASRLRRVGSLPTHEAIEIARQICGGLREAHIQGIVHRDLKPANIIVDRIDAVKIMDFGIARLIHDSSEMTGTISGTPAYMAPEQIELKSVDARTDIYALGLLIYEMIAGRPAFFGKNPIAVAVKQIRDLPTRPREIMPALAAHTEAIILKCLQKDPGKRYQTVDQLDLALSEENETKPGVNCGVSIVPQLQRAALKVQQILCSGIKEAKPALAWWASELRREGFELQRIARGYARSIGVFVRQRDWWTLTRMRSQQALAGLCLVFVVGCVIAFALGRNGKTNNATLAQTPAASHAVQNLQLRPMSSLAPRHKKATTTQEVDLNRGFALAPARTSSSNGSRSRAANPHRSQLSVASSVSSAVPFTMSGTQTVVAKLDTLEVAPLPLDSTLKPSEATNESNPVGLKPGLPIYFLEVGSFKDATWADSAVEKLLEMGFHAVSVQKGHLWIQAYHVQVGPYAGSKDIDDAQRSLASHGFKSHLVK